MNSDALPQDGFERGFDVRDHILPVKLDHTSQGDCLGAGSPEKAGCVLSATIENAECVKGTAQTLLANVPRHFRIWSPTHSTEFDGQS